MIGWLVNFEYGVFFEILNISEIFEIYTMSFRWLINLKYHKFLLDISDQIYEVTIKENRGLCARFNSDGLTKYPIFKYQSLEIYLSF